jgi:hypothetical protein
MDKVQPTVDKVQPTVDKVQPTVDKAQPTVDKAQPTVDKAQPTVDKAQPTVDIVEENSLTVENSLRVRQMKAVQANALELFAKKNADYGDAFAKFGVIGVLMRIEDKIQRSLSITKNGVNLVSDESIRDTLLDLHNYAAMALMLLDEDYKQHTLDSN